jgi:hypothetical protein
MVNRPRISGCQDNDKELEKCIIDHRDSVIDLKNIGE